ncbi:MAG: hypothetical protein KDC80_15010 [Saprospiraceae bacterium]|nr:hypothetical protein [Saprospiraceae bacterium]
MDQFDKKIKQKLAKAPKHQADPEVWAGIAPYLPTSFRSGGSSWLRYAFGLAALLALSGLFFWLGTKYVGSEKLEAEIKRLSASVQSLESERNNPSPAVSDTLVIRDTIWQIYYPGQQYSSQGIPSEIQNKMRVQRPRSESAPYLASSVLQYPVSNKLKEVLAKNYVSLLRGRGSKENNPATSTGRTNKDQATAHRLALLRNINHYVTSKFRRNIRLHPYQGLNAEEIIALEKSKRIWKALIPDHYRIGLVAGGLNLLLPEAEHAQEWVSGFQAELFFSRSISLETGLRYRYAHLKQEHEIHEIKFPLPDNLQNGDRIKEFYSTSQYLNIPLQIKYTYPLSRRFYPYLKSGVLVGAPISEDYKYEVIRNGQEINLTAGNNGSAWALNSYLVGLGMEYNPNYRITYALDWEGRFPISKSSENEFQAQKGLGMRLGIYYNL